MSLTARDRHRIETHSPHSTSAKQHPHPLFPYELKVRNGSCIFLSRHGKCEIYPHRPLLCRFYPLQLHIKWDGSMLWCQERCPGINCSAGTPVNRAYLENLMNRIVEMEGNRFFDTLRDYVLQVKRPVTPLFGSFPALIFTRWPAKERMWGIIWQFFHNRALQSLTPRGRLECILHDLLPPFKEAVVKKINRGPGLIMAEESHLIQAHEAYRAVLPELALESATAQIIHQQALETNGSLKYGSRDGTISARSRRSTITVHRFHGEEVKVRVEELMRMLPLSRDARKEEEEYLQELAKREGRYGKEVADLAVDAELLFQFMVADAVELKANAFSISKQLSEIGKEQMSEAIWIVERTLPGLLRISQQKAGAPQS